MSQSTDIKAGVMSQDNITNLNANFTELYNGIAPVAVTGATVTLAAGTHSNRITTLSRAAGIAVTLPAATGTGAFYELVVITTFTSSATVTCAGSDKLLGQAWVMTDNSAAVLSYDAAGTATTITMDGTTQGGYVGHRILLRDVASAKWHVTMMGKATGSEASPFS